jgi:predicted membrane protein
MKNIITTIFLLFAGGTFAQNLQQKEQVQQTNFAQFYLLEYEIVDVSTPSVEVLNQIPFLEYNQQRHETEDIQIFDPISNYTILLYSNQRCKQNKN